jgi:hypothetical protein
MAELDRAAVLDLLNRLGSDSDAVVVAAARELNSKIGEAGMTWDDLLRLDRYSDDADDDVAQDQPEQQWADAATGDVTADERAEAGRIVDRLLRTNLSEQMRGDLNEIKATVVDGSIDRMDVKYLRALEKRLGG